MRVDKKAYVIDRDELLRKLNEANVQTRPVWSLIHKQKPYVGSIAYKIEKALFFEKNLLNVPCSTNLSEDEVEIVIDNLKRFKS